MKKLWQSEQPKTERAPGKTDPKMQPPEKAAGPKAAAPVDQPQPEKPNKPETTVQTEVKLPEPQSTTTAPRSFIGSKMSVTGELESTEDLLVAGSLEGTVSLPEHTLTVAGGGRVKASVTANSVIVEGEIEGDLDCTDAVLLKPSAKVTGNICMRRINIMDGAVFNGKVTMKAPEK